MAHRQRASPGPIARGGGEAGRATARADGAGVEGEGKLIPGMFEEDPLWTVKLLLRRRVKSPFWRKESEDDLILRPDSRAGNLVTSMSPRSLSAFKSLLTVLGVFCAYACAILGVRSGISESGTICSLSERASTNSR